MQTGIPIGQLRRPQPELETTRWQAFSSMPHRMMFALGFMHLPVALLWWSAELAGRYTGLWPPLPSILFTTWAHVFLLVYGMFPLFIFGFLLTVYPRWMNTQPVPRRWYVTAFFLLGAGLLTVYAGLFTNQAVLALGVGLFLAGWGVVWVALLRVYLNAQVADTRYESLFNFALTAGWIGGFLYFLAAFTGQWMLLHYAIQVGLWLLLVPVTVGVAHRMVPFFTASVLPGYTVYRPLWLLWVVALCAAGHALTASSALWTWRLLFDIPLMSVAFYLSYRWQLLRALRAERLAAVLHIAFLWFGVALLLYNVQSAWLLATGALILGKAPLHALVVGFMTSLLVAMASRVTLGHSGRVPRSNTLTWSTFWGVFLVTVLRLAGELFPLLNLAAAVVGMVVLGVWVGRYLPMVLAQKV